MTTAGFGHLDFWLAVVGAHWQSVLTAAVLVWAAVFLGRQVVNSWRAAGRGDSTPGGCGGCGGCRRRVDAKPLVQLERNFSS